MTALPAITLWQPWASLVIEDAKPFEFRRWPAPKRLIGQRIAIHAGARKIPAAELRGLLYKLERGHSGFVGCKDRIPRALDVVERFWRDPSSIPLLRRPWIGNPGDASPLYREVWSRHRRGRDRREDVGMAGVADRALPRARAGEGRTRLLELVGSIGAGRMMELSVPTAAEIELRLRWRLIEHQDDLVFVVGYVVNDDDLAQTEVKPKWLGDDVTRTKEALVKGTVLMCGGYSTIDDGHKAAFERLRNSKRDMMLTVLRPLTREERAKEVVDRLAGSARR